MVPPASPRLPRNLARALAPAGGPAAPPPATPLPTCSGSKPSVEPMLLASAWSDTCRVVVPVFWITTSMAEDTAIWLLLLGDMT